MTTVADVRRANKTTAMRALHAEGRKKGLGHEELREMAGVASLRELSLRELIGLTARLRGGPGVGSAAARRRRGVATRKRQDVAGVIELVDAKSIEIIRGLAEALGWTNETLEKFVERQLKGRREIRTIGDANAVIRGMRAIYRRGTGDKGREP